MTRVFVTITWPPKKYIYKMYMKKISQCRYHMANIKVCVYPVNKMFILQDGINETKQ